MGHIIYLQKSDNWFSLKSNNITSVGFTISLHFCTENYLLSQAKLKYILHKRKINASKNSEKYIILNIYPFGDFLSESFCECFVKYDSFDNKTPNIIIEHIHTIIQEYPCRIGLKQQ